MISKEKLRKMKIPDKPGVYFFLKGRNILYIGKATSLKDRIKSYFAEDLINTRGPMLVEMLFQASKIDYEVADTVLEALILEANLIKKHQPKYNTRDKSDISFNYVCITKPAHHASQSEAGGENIPRILVMRGKGLNVSAFQKVYGPYPKGSELREALKIIRRIFPFLDDKSRNYLEFYRQINLAPDLSDTRLYLENIKNIKLFFEGKKKTILRNLKKEMEEYAKVQEFEKAGEIKRQIFALQHINDVALIKDTKISLPTSLFRIEAYDIAHMSGKNMVGVMTVVENREVAKSEYRKFKIRTQNDTNDTGALAEVLERRLAHKEWPSPSLIVVDGGRAQINRARSVLKKAGVNAPVVSVLKDERHKPKDILGDSKLAQKYEAEILLANSEAHRFAIAYHKKMRSKNFLK